MANTYFLFLVALSCVTYFNNEVKAACGGIIQKTNGIVTSPYYPSKYPPNHRCTWEIKLPTNNRIGLHFKHLRLQGCTSDYVTIRSRLDNGTTREIGKYCTLPTEIIVSESRTMLIEFVSDSTIEYEGFELEFFSVFSQCRGLITEDAGAITSPQYKLNYPPNMDCIWTIQAPLNHSIKLEFKDLQIEGQKNCSFDYVAVKSKMADGSTREHGRFCDNRTPEVIISQSNVLMIHFVSDRSVENRGFLAVYSFEGCGGLIEDSNGTISTPFYPYAYPPNKICDWTIQVPPQHKIKLRFLEFEIEEGGEDCTNDFMLIQTKTEAGEIRDYGKYCGASKPASIYSNDSILLKFVSDRRFQRTGFKAEYFIDKWSDYEEQSISLMNFSTTTTVDISTPQNRENNLLENDISRNKENNLSEINTIKGGREGRKKHFPRTSIENVFALQR